MTGAAYLFSYLYQLGVKQVFGIPGDELVLFDALAHSKIEFITTRHEQAAAFMAQAVGKVAKMPGVCISTLGPGATNLVTGVADAHQNRSPVVVLSGQLEKRFHTSSPLAHQYVDLQTLFKPITKTTYIINDASEIPQILQIAFREATTGRPGPVHVTLPVDVMEQEIKKGANNSDRFVPHEIVAPTSVFEKAVMLLKKSRHPVAFLGPQAQYAHPSFIKTLQGAHIPVMTSFLGKGSFDEQNEWSLGTVSRHVKDRLRDVIAKADLFLIIDYDYIEGVSPTLFQDNPAVWVSSISAKAEGLVRANTEIVGTVRSNTALLSSAIRTSKYSSQWQPNEITTVKQSRYDQVLTVQEFHSYPYNPFKVMQLLQRVVSDADVIVSDVGNHKQAIGLGLTVNKPLGVHFSNGLSSMGFSLPFAAGLRFAMPKDKRIIAVCGDGGFLMNVQELETIMRYNLNLKLIVFVDNAFGMIKSNLLAKYKRVKNLDFTNPEFSMLAKSFGLAYFAANQSDLKVKLKQLLAYEGNALLTIPIKYS